MEGWIANKVLADIQEKNTTVVIEWSQYWTIRGLSKRLVAWV